MNKTQQLLKSREEEFDKEFPDPIYAIRSFGTEDYKFIEDDIKSFHATTISLLLNSIKESIKEMQKDVPTEYEVGSENSTPRLIRSNGYNEALSDISTLLSETIGNIQTK